MTFEELMPEAVAILKALAGNSQPMDDSPLLRLLLADRTVMGSPTKVHITAAGKRLLARYEAAQE